MNITNRLYTYPVLSNDKDDYKTSFFEAKVTAESSDINNFKLDFICRVTNKEIRDLMLYGKSAEYVIHIECPTTSYRKVIKGDVTGTFSYQIPYNKLNGKVEIVAFILATKDIKEFYSSDWNEDFDGLTFDIPRGSVLAYENLDDYIIFKDDNDLMRSSSIFSVYRRTTDETKPAVVELNDNRIKIGLCTKEYNLYNKYAAIEETRHIVNALVVLPALVYVFEELRQVDSEDAYKDKKWYISLAKAYQKKGIDIKTVLIDETKTSYECAQEAMELPITSALSSLNEVMDIKED